MFNRLSYFFRNYFGFSRAETRGSIVLLIILLFTLFIPAAVRQVLHEDITEEDLSMIDEPWLDSLCMALAAKESYQNNSYYARSNVAETADEKEAKAARLFPFDPNTASVEQLMELGLPDWLAERIEKYRSKGGEFRIKDDLAKIYGMSEEQFATLEPYIQLPDTKPKQAYTAYKKPWASDSLAPLSPADSAWRARRELFASVEFPFDINTADSIQLMALTGIGSKTSARILEERQKLGGFIELRQLEDIWGISDDALAELESKTFIAVDFTPSRIRINAATPEEIWEHPYLNRKQARVVVNYRKQHGPYRSADDLKLIKIIDSETIEKLRPYLDFTMPAGQKSEDKPSNTTPGK
ncbi:ComEA family DNA-binding protein [Roseivirga sp. BDSF3-8]|uniref:ComEA family DNA-binding protein n=1 Tax=Roseivirga sp. BDSF3-8 TaxID=3241598 RepID=UPI0035319469